MAIAAKFPATYSLLRHDATNGGGILVLPSQRTLRDYWNYVRPQQGFKPAVFKDLSDKTKSFSDSERFVTILFDEMKVQEDLVWDKNTGELIGFVDLGDADLNESTFKNTETLASHIFVFLVKDVKNPLSYSFANFATTGASASQIYIMFWQAVCILESACQLKVIASACDGASSNRKFIRMHKV